MSAGVAVAHFYDSCYKRRSTWVCKQTRASERPYFQLNEDRSSDPGTACQHIVPLSQLRSEELRLLGRLFQRCRRGRGPVGGGRPGVAGGRRRAVEASVPVLKRPRRQRGHSWRIGEARKRQAFLSTVFISAWESEVCQQLPSSAPGDRQDRQIHRTLQRLGASGHHFYPREGNKHGGGLSLSIRVVHTKHTFISEKNTQNYKR